MTDAGRSCSDCFVFTDSPTLYRGRYLCWLCLQAIAPPPAYGEPLPSMSARGGSATWTAPADAAEPTREGI